MRTLLFIGQDVNWRHAIVTFLTRAGYRVLEAGDEVGALGLPCRSEIDLILLDLPMRRHAGAGALDAIRTDPEWGRLPRVLLTSDTDWCTWLNGSRETADPVLVKSRFSLRDLLAVVQCRLESAARAGREGLKDTEDGGIRQVA